MHFGQIGATEMFLILMVVLLLFGVGRVSRVGGELGSAIREFVKGYRATTTKPRRRRIPANSAKIAERVCSLCPACPKHEKTRRLTTGVFVVAPVLKTGAGGFCLHAGVRPSGGVIRFLTGDL